MARPLVNLSSDKQLLLACARAQSAEQFRSEAALIIGQAPDLDWQAVLDGALYHGLAPLLWHYLNGATEARVPAQVLAQLRREHDHALAASLLLQHDFRQAVTALGNAGVPVIALKGIGTSELLYAHPGLRPMGDLDLLVPREQLEHAVSALTSLDYREARPTQRQHLAALGDALWPAGEWGQPKHVTLARRDAGVQRLLELHWELEYWRTRGALNGSAAATAWRNAQPMRVAGVQTRLLADEEFVLHLLAHFGLHGLGLLVWLTDIDRLIRRKQGELDWDRITDLARASDLQLVAGATAYCLREWLGTPLPSGVFAGTDRWRTAALEWTLASRGKQPGAPNGYLIELCQWLNARGVSRRTMGLLRRLFPPPAVMAATYDVRGVRLPGAYLMRPLLLVRGLISGGRHG